MLQNPIHSQREKRGEINTKKSGIYFFILFAVAIAAAGSVYLAYCVQFAPWGFSDSSAYFSSARNLASGFGLGIFKPDGTFTPLNLHAPLYPILLSLFARLNIDLFDTVRVLDVAFWALFLLLNGWLFYRISENGWISVCYELACALSFPLVNNFSSLMSEPLAFLLGITGLLLVIFSVKKKSLLPGLIAGLLSGLSLLTRFAFAAVPLAGVIVMLFLSTQPWKKRLLHTLSYGIVSSLPMLIWTVIQRTQDVATGARSFNFQIEWTSAVRKFLSLTVESSKYWLPYRSNMIPGISADLFRPILLAAFLLLVAAGYFLAIRKFSSEVKQSSTFLLTTAMIVFLAGYLVLLFATFAFSSIPSDVNERTLSPILPALFGILLGSAGMIASAARRKTLPVAAAVLLTLFFAAYNIDLLHTYAVISNKFPEGYASPDWKGKPIFAAVEKLPQETPLISNAPDIVLFYTNRNPYYLTEGRTIPGAQISSQDTQSIESILQQHCGALVFFPQSKADRYQGYPEPASAETLAALKESYAVLYSGEDGEILYWDQCELR